MANHPSGVATRYQRTNVLLYRPATRPLAAGPFGQPASKHRLVLRTGPRSDLARLRNLFDADAKSQLLKLSARVDLLDQRGI